MMRKRMPFTVMSVLLAAIQAFAMLPTGAYSNAKYRFSFMPPAGWVEKDNPDAVAIFMEPVTTDRSRVRLGFESNKEFVARLDRELNTPVAAASSSAFRANIAITATKVLPGTSMEQYAKDSRSRMAGLKMYRILGEKPMKLAGVPGIVRMIRVRLADEGGTILTREVLCIQNDAALSFSIASPPSAYSRHAAEFNTAIAGLKWTK